MTMYPGEVTISDDDRTKAILAHATALIGGVLGGLPAFLGPLILMLIYRDRSAYITHHAKEALNFSISVLIYTVISAILIIVLIGFLMLMAVGVMFLVFTILAMIGASRSEWYRYPFTIRFVR